MVFAIFFRFPISVADDSQSLSASKKLEAKALRSFSYLEGVLRASCEIACLLNEADGWEKRVWSRERKSGTLFVSSA